MLKGKEKRLFQRKDALLDVRIVSTKTVADGPAFSDSVGETINVSGGGMYLKVKDSIEINETVRLRFIPPNSFDLFKGTGRVVRAEQNADQTFSVALEFIDIADADRKLLDYYLQR